MNQEPVDVLIIGSGHAGGMAALWSASYPGTDVPLYQDEQPV